MGRFSTRRRGRKIVRSEKDRVIFGICGGIAEYMDVSSFWVRVIFIVLQFTVAPIMILLYIVARFLMPAAMPDVETLEHEIESLRDQPVDLAVLEKQFDLIESKVRILEDYVTSKEFILKRKFENL